MNPVRHEGSEAAGTKWLGEVPSHWQVIRLKNVADYWVSNVDKVPAEGEEPVRLCNYTDVYYHEHLDPNLDLMQTTATAAEIRRFHLQVGDVVITKDSEEWSDIAVPALVTDTAPDLVCGYHLAIVRPRPERLYGPFLQRLFQAVGVNTQLQVSASGITRYSLPKSAIGGAVIPLPPTDEQRTIAEFLDRETATIDGLIARQRALISSLNEQRLAVVSKAVTKGLDLVVPMKNSGIEWLGQIPAHWQVISVRRVLKHVEQGWSPDCSSHRADPDQWGVVKSGCVNYGRFAEDENKALPDYLQPLPEYEIRAGDVLMSRASGSPELVGSTALVTATRPKLLLSDKIFRLHVTSKVLRSYFVAVFNSRFARAQIERAISGADGLARNLPQSSMKDFVIALPPIEEQESIVSHIERACTTTDALTEKALNVLDLLQEYRSALISAAVTGQIDVRNYRPQEAAALCQ